MRNSIGERVAVITADAQVTWAELNASANRYAEFLASAGLAPGDTISVMMENRIEFLALVLAANKLGITTGLINTNLRERPLTHCITVTASKKCIFGGEVTDAIAEVKGELDLTEGADYFVVPEDGEQRAGLGGGYGRGKRQSAHRQPRPHRERNPRRNRDVHLHVRNDGPCLKPRLVSNRRFLMLAALTAKAGLRCTENDRVYICLPAVPRFRPHGRRRRGLYVRRFDVRAEAFLGQRVPR